MSTDLATEKLARRVTRRAARRKSGRAVHVLQIALPFIILIAAWQITTMAKLFPVYLFPPPWTVVEEFYQQAFQTGELWTQLWASAQRVLIGYVPGIGGGLILGVAMGSSPAIARSASGIVKFFNAIPALGWVPLAILWFGVGYKSVAFIIFLSVFFPVLFSTLTGIATIPREYLNVARMCEVSRLAITWKVLVPGAMPSVVNGLRIGAAYGWRALIGAEMIASTSGIGFMMVQARQFLEPAIVIVGMITIGIVWLLIEFFVLRPLEKYTVHRWGLVRTDEI